MRDALGGEFWGAAAYLLVALVAVLTVLALLGTVSPRPTPMDEPAAVATHAVEPPRELPPPPAQPRSASPAKSSTTLSLAIAELCAEAELRRAGLAPDCKTGRITLSHPEHFTPGSSELSEPAKLRLRAAAPLLLRALREKDLLENDRLESIEIRGHADPYARKDPYPANLWRSQQRALALAAFLTGDEELPADDRETWQSLLVASGASFSRPPPSCPEPEPECLDQWRRIEIVFHPTE